MASVCFGKEGYKLLGLDGRIRYESDGSYTALLDYVYKDISALPGLMEQYIEKIIDIETFQLNGRQCNESDYDEIKELFASMHPFCKHNFVDIFADAIGAYFNTSLIRKKHYENQSDSLCDKGWYIQKIKELLSPITQQSAEFADRYYNDYLEWIGAYDDDEYADTMILFGDAAHPVVGFIDELRTQYAIKQFLLFALDTEVPTLSTLSVAQRVWLYGELSYFFDASWYDGEKRKKYNMEAIKHVSLVPIYGFQDTQPYDNSAFFNETSLLELFSPSRHVLTAPINDNPLTKDMTEALGRLVEHTKTYCHAEPYEKYEIKNLRQLLFLEIMQMIQNNVTIKKCEHCDMYFIPPNNRIKFCERLVDCQNVTCSTIGSDRKFQQRMKDEPELDAYNRAYKTRHARVRRANAGSKNKLHDELDDWRIEAKKKMHEVKEGKLSLVEYEAWLKQK